MKKKKLKEKLYKQAEMEEEAALQMVNEAVIEYGRTEEDILGELSSEQLKRLKESIKQADAGKTIPHKEAMNKLRSWRSK